MTATLPIQDARTLPSQNLQGSLDLFDKYSSVKRMRLLRLFRVGDGNIFVMPLDHSVTLGPLGTARGVDRLVGEARRIGVDAVVMHKGRLRWVDPQHFIDMSLIVHVSASTTHAPDPSAKVLVSSVEEALRLGADALSVHLNLGSNEEARQLADVAAVAEACDRWNVPLMAMVYPPAATTTPESVAHAAAVAVDLGCDLVKTSWSGSVSTMTDVVRSCPIPVLTAGGLRMASPDAVVDHVAEVMASGARGVAMGRNVFEAECPATMMRRVRAVVHPALASVRPVAEEHATW